MTCQLCQRARAVATWEGTQVCDPCAAQVMKAHLLSRGRLRAQLNLDATQVVTEGGALILPVLRYWRWTQRVRTHQWATIWHVVAVDPDTGRTYQGRGAGPGTAITLHKKALPRRVRAALGEA